MSPTRRSPGGRRGFGLPVLIHSRCVATRNGFPAASGIRGANRPPVGSYCPVRVATPFDNRGFVPAKAMDCR